MKSKVILIIALVFYCNTNVTYAQFWEGFLYGIGQSAQNYNIKRQNNYSSDNYYQKKYRGNSSTRKTIKKTRKVGDDGFVWYRLERAGLYGIESSDGKRILSPEYGYIYYDEDSGNFRVECKGGCHQGILTKDGSWLIPLNREYDKIYYMDSDGYYSVEKDGYEGACDIKGKEIIAPNRYKSIILVSNKFEYKDNDGHWKSLNIDKYGNKIIPENDNNATNLNSQKTPFKLGEKKFYKIEKLIFGESELPFSAEIAFILNTISFCVDDGYGNVESVEVYDTEYSVIDGISVYKLKGRFALEGATGVIKFKKIANNEIRVIYSARKFGKNFSNEYIMKSTPYSSPILKRP